MMVLVETHRLCSPMPPRLKIVYPRLAWRSIILNVSYSLSITQTSDQQARNKQALSRAIPIPLIPDPTHWQLLGSPLHQESAPLHLKAKIKVLDSITENLELIELHQACFILKNCLSIPKLTYLLRSTPCFECKKELEAFDTAIMNTEKINNVTFGKDSWSQASLSIRHGGLSLRSTADLSLPYFLSSYFACQGLVVNRLLLSFALPHGEVINATALGPHFMINPHDKRKHNRPGMTSLAKTHSLPCSTSQALGTTAGYSLHRKATPLPGQKPSQLLASETCWALMSSEPQLLCELVPIYLKARNVTAESLLAGWGFMASPALRMRAASQDIQP